MITHQDRVRTVLLVHGLEADRRSRSGEGGGTAVVDLTARLGRIHARLDGVRSGAGSCDGDRWLLAVYDAALAELCGAVGVRHSLVEQGVCADDERQRVELELLSSVLPLTL